MSHFPEWDINTERKKKNFNDPLQKYPIILKIAWKAHTMKKSTFVK